MQKSQCAWGQLIFSESEASLCNKIFVLTPHLIQGQVDVCNLTPNTTYEFQLWASNRYGKSETVSFVTTTRPSVSEMGKGVFLIFIIFFSIFSDAFKF